MLLPEDVGAAQLALQPVPVLQPLHLVYPDQPVLGGEGLLQVLQLYVLVADLGVPGPVEAGRGPEVQLYTSREQKQKNIKAVFWFDDTGCCGNRGEAAGTCISPKR